MTFGIGSAEDLWSGLYRRGDVRAKGKGITFPVPSVRMDPTRPFLIGGEWRMSPRSVDVAFPYDGSTVARVALADAAALEDAVRTARAGGAEMARLPSHARSAILARMAALVEARADALAETIVLEAGKTTAMARVEVERAAATLRISAGEAGRIGGEIIDLDWTPAGERAARAFTDGSRSGSSLRSRRSTFRSPSSATSSARPWPPAMP